MEALSLEAEELSPQLTIGLTSFTNDVEGLTFVHLRARTRACVCVCEIGVKVLSLNPPLDYLMIPCISRSSLARGRKYMVPSALAS